MQNAPVWLVIAAVASADDLNLVKTRTPGAHPPVVLVENGRAEATVCVDVDAAVREYCRHTYGPAAGTMLELVTLEIDGWEKSRWPDGVLSPKAIYQHSYPSAAMEKMKSLLAKARTEAAGDAAVLKRLDYFEGPFAEFFKEFEFVVNGKGTRPIIAQKVIENPKVDGKLDDEVWQKAAPHRLRQFQKDKGEVECKFATDVRIVRTLDGITLGFHMAEPDAQQIVQNIQSKDDPLAYWQDCAEFFLDVSGKNAGDWYQFIINARGSVYDALKTDTAWDAAGLKVASYVGDGFWSLEVFLPTSTFPGARPPGTGVEWYGQLVRHRLDHESKKTRGRENQKYNAQFAGFNSNVADFAPNRFVE
ncbi:MAG: hypothetical protein HY000_16830 [Planctomycetes bacterium]|nr:hypothetical protein [Planctomycetota bacterium]